MKWLRFFGLTPLFSLGLSAFACAENCAFLNRDPRDLLDREVYFQIKGDPNWNLLDAAAPDLAAKDVSYAYVIRETVDPTRNGVVVLKSARLPQAGARTRATRTVTLVRHADGSDNKACGAISEFGERPVPAKSYDDFHDLGLAVPEAKTIRSFHIKYAARLNHCRKTDDNRPDSLIHGDSRSNRGQFSFHTDVVARETYSQVADLVGVTRSLADPITFEEQRVEIKQYEVSVNFPTCVRFKPPPQGRSSFLKINDLEGLKKLEGSNDYTRTDEKAWMLSR